MKSLTICVIILVLDVDFSFASGCIVCTGNIGLKKSTCGHYFCSLCLRTFNNCSCGKDIIIDYSNRTIEEDLIKCSVCTNNNGLQQVTCPHPYCNTCTRIISHCNICNKSFRVGCSKCRMYVNLQIRSNKIYCTSCIQNGKIPQEIEESSSRQILGIVPQEIEASSSRQILGIVPQEIEASSSRQNYVPIEFINYSQDNKIENQSINNNNQDNESDSTNKINYTIDSNGKPFYQFL
ncbi:uncharacterized protein LOC126897466 [Daktulosphaira vitifoliae]|uniref:uncharacterized protein LOC126897466 n=1 Tax=Daktulosphaira vitifoliae TaxID=58002 RepID=UPI0021A9EED8|nr:uncharacterized protein LOC126897466 [Daktulosphaira vitifoliae]